MTRIAPRRALVPCLLGLCALAACVVNLSFNYTVSNQPVQQVTTGNSINSAIAVDLSGQSDIQQHAGNIQSLDLDSLQLIIASVASDNSVETVTGTLSLRPSGVTDNSQDVLVGSLNAFAITANNSVTLQGSPALNAFALQTVQGSEKFQAIISGSTTGGQTADFTVNVTLSMTMAYNTGL